MNRLQYSIAQGARVAWYWGQYWTASRLAPRLLGHEDPPVPRPKGRLPGRDDLLGAMRALFQADWKNIEAGVYTLPPGQMADGWRAVDGARRFFADLPEALRRRREHGHSEVLAELDGEVEKLPRYFLQNFHYQSGGYVTDESARLYDHQVEVLFTGTAGPMRRQALVPVREYVRERGRRRLDFLDVAAGTGGFLETVKASFPAFRLTGLDLSEAYLAEARRRLGRRAKLVPAPAEAMPLEDASQDVITSVFLFHELPPKVRKAAAGEIARILRPGGRFVLVDTIQTGDMPAFDGLLETFPRRFHEPYYASYVAEDLPALFGAAGLTHAHDSLAFLSKVSVFEKPA